MASSSAPSDPAATAAAARVVIDEDLEQPVNGSWVAELEDAEADLAAALRANAADDTNATAQVAVVVAHRRLCRAYKMLRRWDRLLIVSKKGLNACRSTATSTPAEPSESARSVVTLAAGESTFREYLVLAEAELAVPTAYDPQHMDFVPHNHFHERVHHNLREQGLQPRRIGVKEAVMQGDVRLMEFLVRRGAPIDLPYEETQAGGPGFSFPPRASALLVACSTLAMLESTNPAWVHARASGVIPMDENSQGPGRIAECAMQLVKLGADPNQKMPRGSGQRVPLFEIFVGKSAFQIATMSKQRPLVALMLEHMQLRPEERAEIVHCRCGSRLPWKQCHSTGPGQPTHYAIDSATSKMCYRVSPLARCPCYNTTKSYFKCCWKDNRIPAYLHDESGAILCRHVDVLSMPKLGSCLRSLAAPEPTIPLALHRVPFCSLLREHPSLFKALCEDVGPKSRMPAWDPHVYAGCLERLEKPLLWRDVHWDLDRSTLLRRSKEWNEALDKYCDDVCLFGDERVRIVRTHRADMCGPCGCVGCTAFEGKALEFRRCAGCMAMCYCSRK